MPKLTPRDAARLYINNRLAELNSELTDLTLLDRQLGRPYYDARSSAKQPAADKQPDRPKRKLSAATRKKMSLAQKARFAAKLVLAGGTPAVPVVRKK